MGNYWLDQIQEDQTLTWTIPDGEFKFPRFVFGSIRAARVSLIEISDQSRVVPVVELASIKNRPYFATNYRYNQKGR
jgi:hypothetical protein